MCIRDSTDIGPHAWHVFLWLGAELAAGATVGCLAGPWLEREGYRSRSRSVDDDLPDSPVRDDDAVRYDDARAADHARATDRGRSGVVPLADEVMTPGPGTRAGGTSRSDGITRVEDDAADGDAIGRGIEGLFRGRTARGAADKERMPRPPGGSTAVTRPQDEPGLSRREEAKRRRAQRRSEKRKAARLAALDDD